jgi:CubicO group peptidase (beta-lactamase class C family)
VTRPAGAVPEAPEGGREAALRHVLAASLTDDEAVVVVVTRTGTLGAHGDTARARPLASLTKPLVAWAVLVAVAEGRIDLDEPAGPTAHEGATVRHLLAHAAGLDNDAGGRTIAPGTRRVYSNWGYEVLGDLLAERTGRSVAEALTALLLDPLGMRATRLEGSPAHGAVGSTDDVARFAAELLAPTLLPPPLADEARTVAFPGLDGVLPGYGRQRPNDWGLGPEVRGTKDPHWAGSALSPATVGHFGRSGSLVWADPVLGVGLATLSDRPFGDWAREAWPRLNDAVAAAARG